MIFASVGDSLIEANLGLFNPSPHEIEFSASFCPPCAFAAACSSSPLTVREALELFGSFYPISTDPHVLLKRWGLREKENVPFEALSGGKSSDYSWRWAVSRSDGS